MSDSNMPDLNNLMNMAQKLQTDMAKVQDELARMVCEASAGGGMVTAQVNGQSQLVSIHIDREVIDPDDLSMLQDLIVAAVNQAMEKMKKTAQEEMAKLTGGLNLPGMPGMF
ncbi:YbaB/EbfC family nucleoid-associated protein [Haliangium sp.]|uniref:YbaB/EbfC family nucleoid-associated protein n=1 Tax=Haliangium sp. TaxID=2663208 RepID=UPI003D13D9FF